MNWKVPTDQFQNSAQDMFKELEIGDKCLWTNLIRNS